MDRNVASPDGPDGCANRDQERAGNPARKEQQPACSQSQERNSRPVARTKPNDQRHLWNANVTLFLL
jgi:hypothetical protein